MTATQQVNLRMTLDEAADLRRLASETGQTASQFMRELVRRAKRQASIEHDVAILARVRSDHPDRIFDVDGIVADADTRLTELDLG